MKRRMLRVIISGGGTGGHVFPAISIANAIKDKYPIAEILFVGAENRMEMERVPAAGYKIIGLPVVGFDRKNLLKNITVLYRLYKSMRTAKKIVKDFRPNIVIGVGGYASGPVLKAASKLGIPTLIQEQNSYPGVTNKLLAKTAARICVAYEGMEKFFDPAKIVITGNPVRQDLKPSREKMVDAYINFDLEPGKKVILVLGGSLGAGTINKSIIAWMKEIASSDVQFIWQCGKYYYNECRESLDKYPDAPIRLTEFIGRMDLAYTIADLVISRAGAGSISEFSLLGKPVILVPSPNVAEDHQTKNAEALTRKDAAIMVKDENAIRELVPTAFRTVSNAKRLRELNRNILRMALPDSANKIVSEIEDILWR